MADRKSLLDDPAFSGIGQQAGGKAAKPKGGGDSGKAIKIVLIVVLFLAAGIAFAWQMGWFDGPPPSTIKGHPDNPVTDEMLEKAREREAELERAIEQGEVSQGGA